MARSPVKKKRAASSKAKPAKKRNYAAEYRRRIELAAAKGYSKSVARGHPKEGEVGRAELAKMRSARRALSPGEKKRAGAKRPVQSRLRLNTHKRVAEIVGVEPTSGALDARQRRDTDGKAFVQYCTDVVGMTSHEAWTLWFSP